jgi:hypothetical protein
MAEVIFSLEELKLLKEFALRTERQIGRRWLARFRPECLQLLSRIDGMITDEKIRKAGLKEMARSLLPNRH